ncbi:MAG: hypothetical protein ABFD83_11345 [Armatimonadota bacterium]
MRLCAFVLGIVFIAGPCFCEEDQYDFVESPVPLGYPDEQIICPTKGTITYNLKINGQSVKQTSDGSITANVNVQAGTAFTGSKTSVKRKASFSGNVVYIGVSNGKRATISLPISTNDSVDMPISEGDIAGIVGRVAVSKKLSLACFALNEAYWQITDSDVTETDTGPSGSVTSETGFSLSVRIPFHAESSGTAFSKFANNAESSGKSSESGSPLMVEGGIFEVNWRDGGSKGSMTIPVVALAGGNSLIVTTKKAMQAQWGDGLTEEQMLIPGTLTVNWSVGNVPVEPDMIISPVQPELYQKWVPVPRMKDNPNHIYGMPMPLGIKAELKPKEKGKPAPKGRIDFYLTDVSENKGRCCNYPADVSKKTDLCFADEQADNIVIDPQDPKHAYTSDRVSLAVVIVESTDCGAYGRVKAVCDELNETAKDESNGREFLSVPRDEDDNHVADAWQEEQGFSGHSEDWDEEKVAGQEKKGDGLSLYREYRGFVVLDGSTLTYKRLSPKEKELFVIDESNKFNTQLWKQASGITAYRLNNQLVFNRGGLTLDRIVDWKMGEPSGYHKYAVRLVVPSGMEDPDGIRPNHNIYGYCNNCDSPEGADYTKVFPARLRAYIEHIYGFLNNALNWPGSDEAKQLQASGLPRWLAQRALEKMSEGTREQLVQQMVTLCAIHEVGHACGLPGHEVTDADGNSSESSEGSRTCPMRYPDEADESNLGILQVLFKSDAALPLQYNSFCKDGQYNCYSKLNVKD